MEKEENSWSTDEKNKEGKYLEKENIWSTEEKKSKEGTSYRKIYWIRNMPRWTHRQAKLRGLWTRNFPIYALKMCFLVIAGCVQFSTISSCSWNFGISSIPDFKFSKLFLIEVNPPGIPSGRCHGRDLPPREAKFNPRARARARGQGGAGLFSLSQLWLGCLWTSPGGPG